MQYQITLPADYDMRIIHRRVAERAGALDVFPGLGLKAYLVRERGQHASAVNQYAPFYLWNDLEGMNRFLWTGGFAHIVTDFGRPVVEQWTALAFERGPAYDPQHAAPRAATRHTTALGPDQDPAAAIDAALGELAAAAAHPGAHATALAIDTRAWQLVHLTLWDEQPAPATPGARYTVLRVNTPGAHALRTGRHW